MQILWYSRVPGFEIAYGGSNDDTFTRFKIGEDIAMYHNSEPTSIPDVNNRRNFVKIIFHTEDVDGLYSHFKNDASILELASFENEATDALWGERFFHIRDPDGYHLQGQ